MNKKVTDKLKNKEKKVDKDLKDELLRLTSQIQKIEDEINTKSTANESHINKKFEEVFNNINQIERKLEDVNSEVKSIIEFKNDKGLNKISFLIKQRYRYFFRGIIILILIFLFCFAFFSQYSIIYQQTKAKKLYNKIIEKEFNLSTNNLDEIKIIKEKYSKIVKNLEDLEKDLSTKAESQSEDDN